MGRIAIIAFAVGLGLAAAVFVVFTLWGGMPVDASCYYDIDPAAPYAGLCFVYSPPVALVMIAIKTLVSFPVFVGILRLLELIVLALLAGPFLGVALFVPPVTTELNAANINLLVVAAVLAGFRRPWTWSLVLITKVTPGVGLLWFAVRREWRSLGIALGATALLVAISFVLAPGLWPEYITRLTSVEKDIAPWPVGIRLPFAIALVIWGARTNRRWVLVIALYLSLPRIYLLSPVVLVGLVPFLRSASFREAATSFRARSRELGAILGRAAQNLSRGRGPAPP